MTIRSGFKALVSFTDRFHEFPPEGRPDMDIGELHDAITGSARRQFGQGNAHPPHPETARNVEDTSETHHSRSGDHTGGNSTKHESPPFRILRMNANHRGHSASGVAHEAEHEEIKEESNPGINNPREWNAQSPRSGTHGDEDQWYQRSEHEQCDGQDFPPGLRPHYVAH